MTGASGHNKIPTLKLNEKHFETDFEKAEILAQKMSENSKGVNNSKNSKKTKKSMQKVYGKTI